MLNRNHNIKPHFLFSYKNRHNYNSLSELKQESKLTKEKDPLGSLDHHGILNNLSSSDNSTLFISLAIKLYRSIFSFKTATIY